MLLATNRHIYYFNEEMTEPDATVRFRGGPVVCAAEGATFIVIAMEDRKVVVIGGAGDYDLDSRIDEPITSVHILQENPLLALLGTEGAHLHRLEAMKLGRVKSFDRLDRKGWYTPWGGPPAVRSMASTADGWVYASIHVGGIMRSKDWGVTWEPTALPLETDVHQVATCPAAPDRVYANTGKAVYISEDRGETWQHRGTGLGNRYGRALAVVPEEPDRLLATVSDGPHGDDVHAQLYLSEDAGQTWQHIREGFPESQAKNIDTYRIAFSPGGIGWALSAQQLYIGEDRGAAWRPFWSVPDEVVMLATWMGLEVGTE